MATTVATALFGAVLPEQPATAPTQTAGSAHAGPTAGPGFPPRTARATSEATMPTLPDFTGDSLDVACHDASDQKREATGRSLWKVCFQHSGGTPEEPTVDFAVVRRQEPCPRKEGRAVPWPVMPDVVWMTWSTAVAKVVSADDVHLVTLSLASPDNGCPAPDRGRDAYLPDHGTDGDPDHLDPRPARVPLREGSPGASRAVLDPVSPLGTV